MKEAGIPWYEEWFDTKLYEKLYAGRDLREAQQLVDLIVEKAPAEGYPSLLDLGCGRGRHSLILAKRGYNVTGVDLSARALEVAREQAVAQGLEHIRFLRQDRREPLDHTFDLILNLFTSFGYFLEERENDKVFAAVRSMLRDNGLFFIDYLNETWVRNTLVPEEEGQLDGLEYAVKRFIEDDRVHKEIHFQEHGSSKRRVYFERVNLYPLEWFVQKLEAHDLGLLDVWGDYDGSEFSPDQSPRLILFCRKGLD
jgi:SAM-dependent methyltransferase